MSLAYIYELILKNSIMSFFLYFSSQTIDKGSREIEHILGFVRFVAGSPNQALSVSAATAVNDSHTGQKATRRQLHNAHHSGLEA
jgi:hypothetical protein